MDGEFAPECQAAVEHHAVAEGDGRLPAFLVEGAEGGQGAVDGSSHGGAVLLRAVAGGQLDGAVAAFEAAVVELDAFPAGGVLHLAGHGVGDPGHVGRTCPRVQPGSSDGAATAASSRLAAIPVTTSAARRSSASRYSGVIEVMAPILTEPFD